MLRLYNTLTRKKEEFQSINAGKAGIYTCGPTVYDYIHIGNIRAYLMADILRRYLSYCGYEVRHIKNITDVGHLTQDDVAQGDSGEDKIEKKAKKEKKTPQEIAEFYESYFKNVEQEMNILPAHYFPRATAHIPQMIKIISTLIEKGYAYEKNGNVFFDVTKFSDYGKLSGNTLDNLKVGARLEEHPDKKNPWDFALWLQAPKEHLMKWESPWSLGYPGWHIECSAMSMEYLGDTIDIHTGAEDNIFPHHEAEIAQSEGASGKKFVNYWVHLRHLLVNGEKMSKSKGNFYVLDDVKKKGYDPMVLRLLMLSASRSIQMNFTWEIMDQAKSNYERISEWVYKLENFQPAGGEEVIGLEKYQKKFEEAMDDDLNTPLALSAAYELITATNKLIAEEKLGQKEAKKILALWDKINKVFGLIIIKEDVPSPSPEADDIMILSPEVDKMMKEREKAKLQKNFKESDRLRLELEKEGLMSNDDKNYYYYKTNRNGHMEVVKYKVKLKKKYN